MPTRRGLAAGIVLTLLAGALVVLVRAAGDNPKAPPPQRPADAIADAQTSAEVPVERPEQKKTEQRQPLRHLLAEPGAAQYGGPERPDGPGSVCRIRPL